MGYLSSYRGDYLASYRGDPGLFGSIFKIIKGAAGGLIRGGPLGALGGAASAVIGGRARRMPPVPRGLTIMGGPTGVQIPTGSLPGPYRSPYVRRQRGMPQVPGVNGRRRRMNPANPKALRRAIRRQTSFIRLARRALKGSGYSITARGSRKRPTARIQEFGPGSVTVAR